MADEIDDGRNSPAQRAKEEEKLEAAGATAATGLGCLTFGLLPFSIVIIVGIIIAIAWVIHKMMTTAS
jgi:hypothetical protein